MKERTPNNNNENSVELENNYKKLFENLYNLFLNLNPDDAQYKIFVEKLFPHFVLNLKERLNYFITIGKFSHFQSQEKMFEYFLFVSEKSWGDEKYKLEKFYKGYTKDKSPENLNDEAYYSLGSHFGGNFTTHLGTMDSYVLKNKGDQEYFQFLKNNYTE